MNWMTPPSLPTLPEARLPGTIDVLQEVVNGASTALGGVTEPMFAKATMADLKAQQKR